MCFAEKGLFWRSTLLANKGERARERCAFASHNVHSSNLGHTPCKNKTFSLSCSRGWKKLVHFLPPMHFCVHEMPFLYGSVTKAGLHFLLCSHKTWPWTWLDARGDRPEITNFTLFSEGFALNGSIMMKNRMKRGKLVHSNTMFVYCPVIHMCADQILMHQIFFGVVNSSVFYMLTFYSILSICKFFLGHKYKRMKLILIEMI
jgi:hypothetical protein